MERCPSALRRLAHVRISDAATFFGRPSTGARTRIAQIAFGLAALPISFVAVFGVGLTRHTVTPHNAAGQNCPTAELADRT